MTEIRKLAAVALKYPDNAVAPMISAKEKGFLAYKMISIAKENNIPVIEDDVLENVLSIQDVGQCVPESTWQAVAGVFAYIRSISKGK